MGGLCCKYGYTSGVDASVAPKVKFALLGVCSYRTLVWLMNIGMGYKVGIIHLFPEAKCRYYRLVRREFGKQHLFRRHCRYSVAPARAVYAQMAQLSSL